MTVILDIGVKAKGVRGVTLLRKIYEDTNIIPVPGVEIEDSAWKKPRAPAVITCSLDEGYYHLSFESDELPSKEAREQEEAMYRLHGWKNPAEWT